MFMTLVCLSPLIAQDVSENEGGEPGKSKTIQIGNAEDAPVRLLRGGEQFLRYTSSNPIIPEDYTLGPLENRKLPNPAVEIAERFFAAVSEGTILHEILGPVGRQELERFLRRISLRGLFPEDYRLGEVRRIDGSHREIPFRWYSGSGRADGLLLLRRIDAGWFITDVQINPEELETTYTPGEGEFEPDFYARNQEVW